MRLDRLLAKHLLIFFNLVFLVFAVGLILMGVMMLLNIYNWEGVVENTIPIYILILGCLIFVFGCIGLCGAVIEDSSLTLIYSIFMLILLTLEFLLLFYTYYDKDKLVTISEEGLKKAWKLQKEGKPDLMNVLQMRIPCCGIEGDSDYEGRSIPQSCYENYKRVPNSATTQGCRSALKSYIYYKSNDYTNILLVVVVLQILIFALACSVSEYDGSQETIEFTNFLQTKKIILEL